MYKLQKNFVNAMLRLIILTSYMTVKLHTPGKKKEKQEIKPVLFDDAKKMKEASIGIEL